MGKIMIVDDEKELLVLYSEMLELFGHSVICRSCNGEEALEDYRNMEEKPDLIILDHRMPIINGLETASEILNLDPEERIIFVSADPSVKRAALEIGVIDFLEKPFVLKTLKEKIDNALRN